MRIKELESYHLGYYDVKDQLKRHVYSRSESAFRAGDAARDAIRNAEELLNRQSHIRGHFKESVGGWPAVGIAVNAEVMKRTNYDGFTVENIIIESRPNVYVTANLYVPDGLASPTAAVLFLCGHAREAKSYPEYRNVCRYMALSGMAALAIDPLGQGERLNYIDVLTNGQTVGWGTMEHSYAGAQCWPLGDGLARYFVHDAMRAVDYLISRPEVDPAKIGVTGNSGGGTQTAMMMMADERIAAAAPGTFVMNRQTYMYAGGAQDAEQIWPNLTAVGIDHEDILIAMAPKPVLVLAARYDFFPIEGTRRTVERSRRLWELHGKGDDLVLFEDDSVHKYTTPMAERSAAFFAWHLLGKRIDATAYRGRSIDPAALQVTATGQILTERPNACAIHNEIVNRSYEIIGQREALQEDVKRARAAAWLKELVFDGREKCELNPRHYMMESQIGDLSVYNSIWRSQPDVFGHAFFLKHNRFTNRRLPVTIALWEYGSGQMQAHFDWITRTCAEGRGVVVLDVSGTGPLMPHAIQRNDPYDYAGIFYKLTHDLLWLGDSLAAIRTYDAVRAVDLVERMEDQFDPGDIRFYTHGRANVYGMIAALLDERIRHVTTANGEEQVAGWVQSRHYNNYDVLSYVVPGILQYCDIPDISDWLGRRLTCTPSNM